MIRRYSEQDRWLAAAAIALAEAERMIDQLSSTVRSDDLTLAELQAEIMMLRLKIERRQRNGVAVKQRFFQPALTEDSPWPVLVR